MGTISLRLNDRDDALIRKYAAMHDVDLSSFIRQTVIEKIEKEHDLTLFDRVWAVESLGPRIPHEEVKKVLNP